jgi:topoisomerase IV subunit A
MLKATFELTDNQANYILDTRLRSLRRLEEMQLRGEHDALTAEKTDLNTLIGDESRQWKTVTAQIREVKKKYGPHTALGKRRTSFQAPPAVASDFDLAEILTEREPVTIVVTQKGWIRALKGHVGDLSTLQFKGDDSLRISFFAETTSKILVLATNGKVFTLDASKLPGGRGAGEPIRLLADIDDGEDVSAVFVYKPGQKMIIACGDGRGFVAAQDEMIANTRKGKMLFNVEAPAKATIIVAAEGDHVAAIGENRKLLVYPLNEIPEMTRGKGVRLQRYKDGGVADARVFAKADGLTWQDSSGRSHNRPLSELKEWVGDRAQAGRLPPQGFPRHGRFGL